MSKHVRALIRRIVERIDKWAEPRPRCPWRVPLTGEQCIYDEGHRHACCTEVVHTNKRTGRQSVTAQFWAGINYDTEDR